MIRLADLIAEQSGLHKTFFTNSGAEAIEGAIKLARKWGKQHRGGAYEIITMDHGFHGRTLAAMAASGKAQWEHLFEPKVPGFTKVPLNDLAAVEARDHAEHRRRDAGADPGRGRRVRRHAMNSCGPARAHHAHRHRC